jgi:phospholipid/cholesterol/gamma-HCH transport system permease protein
VAEVAVNAGTPLPPILTAPVRFLRRILDALLGMLDDLGAQLSFYARSIGWTWRVALRYKKEVIRLLAEVSLGSGALALVGGTIGVIAFLTFFTGTEVGLQGYAALNQLGTANFTAFLSAYFNTREIAPLVAGLALSATVGCGFTAQLGAMRISEEVDALEVMGVPSLPFLVTTRMIAGFVAVIPLYVIGLLSSYFAARLITTGFYGQSTGTYDQYFQQYLPPIDVIYSFVKVLIFAVIIILIHCYYGYYASGGPAGVGVAVGRAVRTAIVAINLVDFFLSLAIWGATTTVKIAG